MSYQEKIADIRQQGGINFHFPFMKQGGVKPGLWNHLCISYSSSKRHLVFIHNGAVQFNYTNVPLAFEVSDGLPKSLFTPFFRTPEKEWKSPYWNKDCEIEDYTPIYYQPKNCKDKNHNKNMGRLLILLAHYFVGYYTDKNMWSRALSIEEMIQWTKEGKLWEYPINNEAGRSLLRARIAHREWKAKP